MTIGGVSGDHRHDLTTFEDCHYTLIALELKYLQPSDSFDIDLRSLHSKSVFFIQNVFMFKNIFKLTITFAH